MSSSTIDHLLSWLHHNRDQAAQKYEGIRSSLVKIFAWEGCADAEGLADEVIDRVAARVPDIVASYTGDPSLYFYGVAKRVLVEQRRRNAGSEVIAQVNAYKDKDVNEGEDHKHKLLSCFENCVGQLPVEQRELVIRYYSEQGQVQARELLAKELGLSINALRVQMHRSRAKLKRCIEKCLKEEVSSR
jgi:RNA polymerase sigma factor (sigma-70 family)